MRRIKPPRWIKPLLVPVYNGVHRALWWLREYGGAVAARRGGRCEVCGRSALFLEVERAIPAELARRWGLTPRTRASLVAKETRYCSRCRAPLRGRRLATVMMELIPVPGVSCLKEWVEVPEIRSLAVAEINFVDGMHEVLRRLPHLAYSEYREGAEPGSTHDGRRHEDITRLTYADASFDMVVTSETLEHVPDVAKAIAETYRVLKPGGVHVLTVPLLPGVARTFPRSRLRDGGTVEHLATPICHPGGDRGWPVFTEFGADLPQILAAPGFDVEERFGPNSEDDIGQVYVCRKPR